MSLVSLGGSGWSEVSVAQQIESGRIPRAHLLPTQVLCDPSISNVLNKLKLKYHLPPLSGLVGSHLSCNYQPKQGGDK